MERDFGVSKALPSLQQDKHNKVVDFLQNHEVDDEADLKEITVEDLTENKLLSLFKARRLVKHWQEGGMSNNDTETSSPQNQGTNIRQVIHGKTERVIASKTYNENNNQTGTMNNFNDSVRDVQTGGKRKTSFQTTFGGSVQTGVLHTGQGNATNQ